MSLPTLNLRLQGTSLMIDITTPEGQQVAAAVANLPVELMAPILTDAQEAKALIDAGHREEGIAIIMKYRDACYNSGLGVLFEAMLAEL